MSKEKNEEAGNFYKAQKHAGDLEDKVARICREMMDECVYARRAAEKRQPRKYNGHVNKVEKMAVALRRSAQYAHMKWIK